MRLQVGVGRAIAMELQGHLVAEAVLTLEQHKPTQTSLSLCQGWKFSVASFIDWWTAHISPMVYLGDAGEWGLGIIRMQYIVSVLATRHVITPTNTHKGNRLITLNLQFLSTCG